MCRITVRRIAGVLFILVVISTCAVLLYNRWIAIPGGEVIHVWDTRTNFDPEFIEKLGPENVAVTGRATDGRSVMVCSINNNGEIEQTTTWNSEGPDSVSAMTGSQDGHIYIAGLFRGMLPRAESSSIPITGGGGAFLCKYNTQLELEWEKIWGHAVSIIALALSSDGKVIALGHYEGSAELDPNSDYELHAEPNAQGFFVIAFANDGRTEKITIRNTSAV